jgi:polar amino acid transport system substrate-binding protein
LVILLALPAPARGDTLDDVLQRRVLRWGGDQEGGGPYVYPDPNKPQRLIGFEVELMDKLAASLGVRAEFRQCEWENLPDLLRTGGIDVIANGYELTQSRLKSKIASIPYYIYELQLIARRKDASIRSWDDFKTASSRKVIGVLGQPAADYVISRLGDCVTIRRCPGATDAMLSVQNRNLDATVQDWIAAKFYENRFPSLHFVGQPEGRGYYVIYMRPGEGKLRDAINTGLLKLIKTGELRKIYEHYGMWNQTQADLGKAGLGIEVEPQPAQAPESDKPEASTEVRGLEVLRRNLPLILQAAAMTVALTCSAMPLAVVLGLFLALGRLYGPRLLAVVLTMYVEVIRGTPLMLQLYTIYYVLPPALGFSLHPVAAAIIGLALNYAAYESEIYRAGLLAIPRGQMEAALSLGMSRRVALRRVIIPQAVRLVIPPVTNDFIAMFKDTSICSAITVVELTKQYYILVNNTNAYLELAIVTALLYLMMSYPLSLLARSLEKRAPRAIW